MKKKFTNKEFKTFKEAILRDLNSEAYPFAVSVHGDKIVVSWKMQNLPKDVDQKAISSFSVTYLLRRDGSFSGGETTVHRDTYTRPMSTETRTVYSLSTPKNLPWRKRVDSKDWPNIGYDEDKLLSIIENYLRDHDFTYRPGVWNHARLSREEGYLFRIAGGLFLAVGIFLLVGFLNSSMYRDLSGLDTMFAAGIILLLVAVLLPLIIIVVGSLMLLIGFGKMDFYDLRPDVGIKLVVSVIVIGWIVVFVFMKFV